MSRSRTILVTGATGALGGALVERLAGEPLVCLVHRTRPRRDDVECVEGDLTRPLLGLARDRYAKLARSIDCIVHAGAVTDPFAAVGRIRETNVEGTRHVAELARAAGARLVHVSTAFAPRGGDAGSDGAPDRRDPHAGAQAYARSKRAAEALLAEAGVPHVNVRTSIVAGDSRTGEIGRLQGLHTVIGLIARGRLPMLPVDPDGPIDFLPRDLVADAVGSLVESGVREGSYWLTAGERALTVRQVVETAARFGHGLGNEAPVPRFIDPGALDRLIRPVFFSELPDEITDELERLFALFSLVDAREPFPTSLGALGLEPPDLVAVLEATLAFWAACEPTAGAVPGRADELERWLVGTVQARLPGGGTVDAETPFADAGLDSVDVAAICEELESAFGCRVAVTSFYEQRNARQLARLLASEQPREEPAAPDGSFSLPAARGRASVR